MANLTDTQLIMLSKAAPRDDGAAIAPANLNKASAAMVGSSLVKRGLMQEVLSEPGMPVWRENDQGERFSMIIAHAGREAIGVADEVPELEPQASKLSRDFVGAEAAVADNLQKHSAAPPRARSKQALLVELLLRESGATLDDLIETTGWLADIISGKVASFEELAEMENLGARHIRRLAPLAFLSPKIIQALANGDARMGVSVSRLSAALPPSWVEQEKVFGLR